MASATAVTMLATRKTPLSEQEQAATGYNSKFTILYGDIGAGVSADEVVTITLGATPTKWYIDKAGFNVKTAFNVITALTCTVGTTTSTAALMSSTSILTAAFLNQTVGTPILTNTNGVSAVNLVAIVTAAGTGGVGGLTAGQLDIYLRVINAAKLP
jgi:hypothetical protein